MSEFHANGIKISTLCMDELKKRGCDFSLLFWLRNHESLVGTDIGKDFDLLFEDLKISQDLFTEPAFRDGFFQTLRQEFNKSGLKQIAPDNFVVDDGEGGKDRAIQKARKAQWPRPYQTFCFQTRGKNSAFFIFQCWQDGIRKILELIESQVFIKIG